jgi:ectoine hydroxylase-related dioxygenase (phytanoyl-CoA dioxygenase family)
MTDLDAATAAADAELHPWNAGFEWPRHDGPYRRVTPEQAKQYDEDGYFLLEDVIAPAALDELRREIEPHERAVNEFLKQLDGGRFEVAAADRLTVTLHLSTLSDACRRFVQGQPFADLCHDLVGNDVRLYWDQAVYKLPHNDDVVPWHQDNGYAFVDEPQDYLTCWVPLVDATLDNGCVWVVPGAHRRGTLSHWHTDLGWRCLPESTEGAVPIEAPAGSVVVFSSLTPHRTGPNITDDVRAAYILQYLPDGASVLRGDPSGPPPAREPQDDEDRQVWVVREGRPVA